MKKRLKLLFILLSITLLFTSQSVIALGQMEEKVYLGGMPAGFIIDNKGAVIIGVNDVISNEGIFSPAKDADVKSGDILLSIDGYEINCAADIELSLCDYKGEGATAVIDRGGEILIKIIYPVKDVGGKYRVGMFVRDEITGIGTITYVKDDLTFAALGHPVVDASYQKLVKINSGKVFKCNIVGVNKGERGRAGEIRGFFMSENSIGVIDANRPQGIFGKLTDKSIVEGLTEVCVGTPKQGKAKIFTTIDGESPLEYSVDIVKFDARAPENKNLVIKITDEKLLSKTNGILQGMSGSPIVQDGKLVGAVTHVFVNDPSRGFGISVKNMLEA